VRTHAPISELVSNTYSIVTVPAPHPAVPVVLCSSSRFRLVTSASLHATSAGPGPAWRAGGVP
jgi:hypothetical protein